MVLLGLVQSVCDVLYAVLHLLLRHIQNLRRTGIFDKLGGLALLFAFVNVFSLKMRLLLPLDRLVLRSMEDFLHPLALIFLARIFITDLWIAQVLVWLEWLNFVVSEGLLGHIIWLEDVIFLNLACVFLRLFGDLGRLESALTLLLFVLDLISRPSWEHLPRFILHPTYLVELFISLHARQVQLFRRGIALPIGDLFLLFELGEDWWRAQGPLLRPKTTCVPSHFLWVVDDSLLHWWHLMCNTT